MTLKLSKNVNLTDLVTFANPISTQHMSAGEAKQVLVYLFSDDATKFYENIVVTAIDTAGTNESSWISFAHDNAGSSGSFSSSLSLGEITEANAAKAFWIKVTNVTSTQSQNKADLNVRVSSKEFAV